MRQERSPWFRNDRAEHQWVPVSRLLASDPMRRWGVAAGVIALVAFLPPLARAAPSSSSSPFALREIIEGYYGTPFTHPNRLDLVRWEAAHGMNIYRGSISADQRPQRRPTSDAEHLNRATLALAGAGPEQELLFGSGNARCN